MTPDRATPPLTDAKRSLIDEDPRDRLHDEPDGPVPARYESASARLDEIVRRLDTGEAGLRETLELCQEGRRLVEFCAGELEAVGRGLEELRLEDLVTRLAGRRSVA